MFPRIKRAFLDTEDGQIHYRTGGEGKPLLLLHMNPRSSDEFRESLNMGFRDLEQRRGLRGYNADSLRL